MSNLLLDLLDVEQLDRDLYRARSHWSKPRPHLFGGQVAAQALRAATLTVPADRQPHSLHGYFLRRGTPERPIILRVYRDRDGGSFSARRVVAIQDGAAVFTVSASFHAQEPSGDFQVDMGADAPDPESVPLSLPMGSRDAIVEMRPVETSGVEADAADAADAAGAVAKSGHLGLTSRVWIRAAEQLPDDDALHACALTYISDYGSGFAEIDIPNLAQGGPSLDHCIWFHHPIRLDDWVLLDLWPLRASSAAWHLYGDGARPGRQPGRRAGPRGALAAAAGTHRAAGGQVLGSGQGPGGARRARRNRWPLFWRVAPLQVGRISSTKRRPLPGPARTLWTAPPSRWAEFPPQSEQLAPPATLSGGWRPTAGPSFLHKATSDPGEQGAPPGPAQAGRRRSPDATGRPVLDLDAHLGPRGPRLDGHQASRSCGDRRLTSPRSREEDPTDQGGQR